MPPEISAVVRMAEAMKAAVQTFDPQQRMTPSAERIERLLEAAEQLGAPNFCMSDTETKELAPLMQCPLNDWRAVAGELKTSQLIALARFFTLAEALPGWQAGDQSPVIAFMAELRKRQAVPSDLGAWIRANSENRFLPWGNLLDRL